MADYKRARGQEFIEQETQEIKRPELKRSELPIAPDLVFSCRRCLLNSGRVTTASSYGLSKHLLMLAALLLSDAGIAAAIAQERELGPDVRMHSAFPSKFLSAPRDIIVWLPPGYDTDREARYPVLYLHDGANAYVEWRIDETAKQLIAANHVTPMIMVLIPNGGSPQDRFEDYTWTKPSNAKFGGKAHGYGQMLVEELKPFIDKTYRTRPEATNTALGGSSLGGLVSLYFGLKYPDVFGSLVVMSPAVWWDNKVIIREVKQLKARPPARIWLDVGAAEDSSTIANTKDLRDALVGKGWKLGSDLVYFELPNGKHDEASFAKRAADVLKYIFPGREVRVPVQQSADKLDHHLRGR